MLTTDIIRKKAAELGAVACGVGSLDLFEGEDPRRDPKMILPKARCIIGFGIPIPRGLYHSMEHGGQYYTYTSVGVNYVEEEYFEIFLFRIGNMIEDEGYDACLQRAVPNLRVKGDKETNPEVVDTYELIYASPVEEGKPAPDVLIDFGKAAQACGIGRTGKDGRIINRTWGPFMRYAFIITDAPLETGAPYGEDLCAGCRACIDACPAHCIDEEKGLDTWSCAVYYRGAHRSNPLMTDDFLRGDPEREAILNGEKRFTAESARALYPKLHFLPAIHGYAPCLCGKKCDIACYRHITGKDV